MTDQRKNAKAASRHLTAQAFGIPTPSSRLDALLNEEAKAGETDAIAKEAAAIAKAKELQP